MQWRLPETRSKSFLIPPDVWEEFGRGLWKPKPQLGKGQMHTEERNTEIHAKETCTHIHRTHPMPHTYAYHTHIRWVRIPHPHPHPHTHPYTYTHHTHTFPFHSKPHSSSSWVLLSHTWKKDSMNYISGKVFEPRVEYLPINDERTCRLVNVRVTGFCALKRLLWPLGLEADPLAEAAEPVHLLGKTIAAWCSHWVVHLETDQISASQCRGWQRSAYVNTPLLPEFRH